jgi:hypothetical protein
MTKPTISQLEELLDRSENSWDRDEQEIEILPNGEIRAKGGGAAEGVKPLTFRENLGGEYGLRKAAKLAFAALLIFAASICAHAQQSDISLGPAYLTAACTNANTTCDTANVPTFGPNGSVLGPATLEGSTQGYGLVEITVNGVSNAVGSTILFEFSDDGGTSWYTNTCTRSDAAIQEISEAVPTTTYRAWDCAVGAATRFRVRQSAISSGQLVIRATLTAGLEEPAPTVQLSLSGSSGSNPCWNPHANLQFLSFNTSGTSATQIIAASGTTKIYVCSFLLVPTSGTTPTFGLVTGTGTNCAGGQTVLVPAFATTTAGALFNATTNPVALTPAGGAVCYLDGGTTPVQAVILTYVQQ